MRSSQLLILLLVAIATVGMSDKTEKVRFVDFNKGTAKTQTVTIELQMENKNFTLDEYNDLHQAILNALNGKYRKSEIGCQTVTSLKTPPTEAEKTTQRTVTTTTLMKMIQMISTMAALTTTTEPTTTTTEPTTAEAETTTTEPTTTEPTTTEPITTTTEPTTTEPETTTTEPTTTEPTTTEPTTTEPTTTTTEPTTAEPTTTEPTTTTTEPTTAEPTTTEPTTTTTEPTTAKPTTTEPTTTTTEPTTAERTTTEPTTTTTEPTTTTTHGITPAKRRKRDAEKPPSGSEDIAYQDEDVFFFSLEPRMKYNILRIPVGLEKKGIEIKEDTLWDAVILINTTNELQRAVKLLVVNIYRGFPPTEEARVLRLKSTFWLPIIITLCIFCAVFLLILIFFYGFRSKKTYVVKQENFIPMTGHHSHLTDADITADEVRTGNGFLMTSPQNGHVKKIGLILDDYGGWLVPLDEFKSQTSLTQGVAWNR